MTSKYVRPPMIYLAHEFLDQLFWRFHRLLHREDISVLQWAMMLRSYVARGGVQYRSIQKATGQPLDNVRRAAESLQACKIGKVIVNPVDKRARIFVLSSHGKKLTRSISDAFKADLLVAVGAREILSIRAQRFTRHLWHASVYLACGDIDSDELIEDRSGNRAAVHDNSLKFVELPKQAEARPSDLEELPF